MNKAGTVAALALLLLMMGASLIAVKPAVAQSIPKPSAPEFSLQVIDDSYIIPFKNVTTTDPYTGKVTWLIEGGGHVENQKVVVTIRKPSFTPIQTSDGYLTDLCFSVRAKGHYEEWQPSAEPHLIYAVNASAAENTVATYYLQGEPGWGSFHNGGEVDVEVKALIGYHYTTEDYSRVLHQPIYTVQYVELAESDWSSTQTVTVPRELANPLPPWWIGPTPQSSPDITTPEVTVTPTATAIQSGLNLAFPTLDWIELFAFAIVALVFALLVVVIFFMRRRIRVLELKQNGT
jgi:hypothetical protein